MNDQSNKHSSLFLMELIIAVLMFSLCAAICINIFIRAHTINTDSFDLTMAVTHSSNMAEIFSTDEEFADIYEEQYNSFVTMSDEEDRFLAKVFFDKEWKECAEDVAKYNATIEVMTQNQEQIADFTIVDDKENIIYNLQSHQHRAQYRGEALDEE